MHISTLRLSFDQSLVYVLRASVCLGRLTSGHIERISEHEISLHDEHGAQLEYFSGSALRSWCVVDSGGKPLDGWHNVLAEDTESLLAFACTA
jgi:hypothetical protein